MDISEFDYELPTELIAREPIHPRDASRMMVLDASSQQTADLKFSNLPELLRPDDVVVLNNTKVVHARTMARLERRSGSSRMIEVFFAEPADNTGRRWQVLCKPGRRIRPGDRVIFGDGEYCGVFLQESGLELHILELESPDSMTQILMRFGQVPLPPYLNRQETPADERDYQTVYAEQEGAVAAPTAGLHFTSDVLAAIHARGIETVNLTLHVGIGTFLPVRSRNVEEHVLRPERYEISQSAAESLRKAQREGKRIVAVGTTTTRTLEYLMREHGEIRAGAGKADIFILPGFQFRIVGALLTNFHLPESTLLMLVSAFAGRETIFRAYLKAIEARYRFYSYGDCMFIQR